MISFKKKNLYLILAFQIVSCSSIFSMMDEETAEIGLTLMGEEIKEGLINASKNIAEGMRAAAKIKAQGLQDACAILLSLDTNTTTIDKKSLSYYSRICQSLSCFSLINIKSVITKNIENSIELFNTYFRPKLH